MEIFSDIGIQKPDLLLPNSEVDLERWSVIACDQFTSQPAYWEQVSQYVDDQPSTLRMILPEVYLDTPNETELITSTQATMRAYLEQEILIPHEGFIMVERTVSGKTRTGLMVALDLEQYDFRPGSQTIIRATEGTIVERLPPRIRIREHAPLEIPHILVLIDDPERSVIEPLVEGKSKYPKAYDFDLMKDSGHLTGYFVDESGAAIAVEGLRKLSDSGNFRQRYSVSEDKGVLLFAIGDGNHSLATAKSIWETVKRTVGMSHPARYALVELENLHDAALEFEPIHRVVFEFSSNLEAALVQHYGSNFQLEPAASMEAVVNLVKNQKNHLQTIGVVHATGYSTLTLMNPSSNLAVGSLQAFLDSMMKEGKTGRIDYVHGNEVVDKLGKQPGNYGFLLPAMEKHDLFKTVILDGALPRKTFSMGEAHEKRFYLECRRIA